MSLRRGGLLFCLLFCLFCCFVCFVVLLFCLVVFFVIVLFLAHCFCCCFRFYRSDKDVGLLPEPELSALSLDNSSCFVVVAPVCGCFCLFVCLFVCFFCLFVV
jgi:hypothetical protein